MHTHKVSTIFLYLSTIRHFRETNKETFTVHEPIRLFPTQDRAGVVAEVEQRNNPVKYDFLRGVDDGKDSSTL